MANQGKDRIMSGKTIQWTEPMRDRFRKAYNQAVKDGKGAFSFDGNDFHTGYAKYLLEHLDNVMGGK